MCGRYYIDDGIDSDELQEIIDAVNRRSTADQVKTSGEIFPTDTVPIIANSRAMAPSAFAMSWGYSLPDGKRIINARSESAEEKPMFRDSMAQRRCAVPATNYFEWERAGKQKTKYSIRSAGNGLMYMAGIYRVENGRPVFTILTRDPAESISFIHNRMPVLLPSDMGPDWINSKYSAGDLLRNAILDVQSRPVEPAARKQIGMEI